MPDANPESDSRQLPRLKLPAMYTLVRVRPAGEEKYTWSGFIYDISEGGMRFEIDDAIEPGTKIEVRAMLPGATHVTFEASGTVVRIHDDDDNYFGPTRMGLIFDEFKTENDHMRLNQYITTETQKAA